MELKEFKNTVIPLRLKLVRYAFRITENESDAEDVVQEVLIKLWNQRTTLEQCHSVEAWAMKITHNAAIDLVRCRHVDLLSIDGQTHSLQSIYNPERELEEKNDKEIISYLLSTLPNLQKMTIELKDLQGYENHEIAEILGCQEEAVRSNLSRGRKKLRDLYLTYVQQKKGGTLYENRSIDK